MKIDKDTFLEYSWIDLIADIIGDALNLFLIVFPIVLYIIGALSIEPL